jgi:hypothetical protein
MPGNRGETTARRAGKKKGAGNTAGTRKKAPASSAAKATTLGIQVTPEQRHQMIEKAAYLRAEQAGFECDPSECWLVAEEEIDSRLASPTSS